MAHANQRRLLRRGESWCVQPARAWASGSAGYGGSSEGAKRATEVVVTVNSKRTRQKIVAIHQKTC